ncbi:MAG: class I SAM-dependent methyltransferase [bacterium]
MSTDYKIDHIVKKAYQEAHRLWLHLCEQQRRKVVSKLLLRSDEAPHYYDSDEVFERLQRSYRPLPEYGYDTYNTWKRGTERTLNLLEITKLHAPGLTMLDAACGDGMTGYALSCYGHRVTLTDIEDWRDIRAKELPFMPANLSIELPLDSNSFDLIYSYNAFEHLDDPSVALRELVRVCKKGGYIYIEFGPIYSSPWGLHSYRTIRMPYPQFLFSKSFLEVKLEKLGVYDLGRKCFSLQPLNQWRVSDFDSLWQHSQCEIVSHSAFVDNTHLDIIKKFHLAFTGMGLTIEDVTTQALVVMLRKK